MLVMEFGIVMLVKFLQSENAPRLPPILVTANVKPATVTVDGIVTDVVAVLL